jgi:hypothetical protein
MTFRARRAVILSLPFPAIRPGRMSRHQRVKDGIQPPARQDDQQPRGVDPQPDGRGADRVRGADQPVRRQCDVR